MNIELKGGIEGGDAVVDEEIIISEATADVETLPEAGFHIEGGDLSYADVEAPSIGGGFGGETEAADVDIELPVEDVGGFEIKVPDVDVEAVDEIMEARSAVVQVESLPDADIGIVSIDFLVSHMHTHRIAFFLHLVRLRDFHMYH